MGPIQMLRAATLLLALMSDVALSEHWNRAKLLSKLEDRSLELTGLLGEAELSGGAHIRAAKAHLRAAKTHLRAAKARENVQPTSIMRNKRYASKLTLHFVLPFWEIVL